MCGIAGILNLDGRPAAPEEICAITRALAHRGPDGEGVHVEGPLGLGHRRLAILDLSESGKQPMDCVDGRYWITFNGEIFNFVELRRELEACGHRFRTGSDTEVIGHAYQRWGTDCVLHFNGMWAFAVWDVQRRELFLSRDHFGIKPLFDLAEPNRFVFASELKSFLYLRDFVPRENEEAMKLALFKSCDFEVVDDTLLLGVKRLQGGHNMKVGPTGIQVWRWWQTLDHVPSVPSSIDEQAEAFRELFFDACRLRLRSDVPVATCLSGGVDSSAVLCTLAALRDQANGATGSERLTPDSQRAFVATFPGTPKDERKYAELAIQHSAADPRYRPMDPDLTIENLREYAYDFENVGGSLMIPLWRIYRELRRDSVVVSLDGHGGDELLAGYEQYVGGPLSRSSMLRTPRRTLDLVNTLRPMHGPGPPGRARLLLRHTAVGYYARRMSSRIRPQQALKAIGGAWMGTPLKDDGIAYPNEDELAGIESLNPLDAELYTAVHRHYLPHILRNFERCSMAHGVEVRMPFLDWRLVCFTFGLPEESKIGNGFTKRVLREAMRNTMPEKLRTRKDKIGFSPPMSTWFNGGLGDWVSEQVRSASFLDSAVWNGPAIRDHVEARRRAGPWTEDDSERVWPFVQAQLWRQLFLEEPAPQLARLC